MRIVIAYCYPMVNTPKHFTLATRFADTWKKFPPTIPHELHVICSGATATDQDKAPFNGIAVTWHTYNNVGWDIGAFQWISEKVPCDMLVCMGAYCHFHRSGWLERMVEVYIEHGPNYYGTRGYFYPPSHHIRTTVFWMSPHLLNSYPEWVTSDRSSRYKFEHGHGSMTEWVEKAGMQALGVTWDGVYGPDKWPDCFGPDESALVFDQWTNHGGSGVDRK